MKRIITSTGAEAQALTSQILTHGLPSGATELYRGRNVVAAYGDRCLKVFAVPGAVKGYIYGLFRHPKAQRAYDNALRLIELGISTPVPIAFGAEYQGGRLRKSVYICALLKGFSELRGIESRPDFESIVRDLAAFMFELHRKGIYFKDFTQGNILFRKTSAGYEFSLVDINRMAFGITDHHLLYHNFGSTLDTEAGQRVLARAYAKLCGNTELAEELMDIYRRRQARLWCKRRFKEFFKSSRR